MAHEEPAPDELPSAACASLHEEAADDLYENAPCGYFSTLDDGTIVGINRTLLDWTGYPRDALLGRKRIHDLLAPGDRIYYETHYAPLLRMQGSVRELALELVCADGGRLPVLINSVLGPGSGDAPALVRTMVFDASERRRYERELLRARREAEERARAALALAHVHDGVLLVGADGCVQLVNAAGAEILGVAEDALVGRPVAEAIGSWPAIAGRIPIGSPGRWPSPAVLPLARGEEEAWLAVAGVESGDGVIYTLRDVTSDHRLEQLRSDVVAVVSHELRTPLAAMYGAAQTLLHQESLDETLRRQLLDVIVEQGEAQRRVLDQIALTSRLDTEVVELSEEVLVAHEILDAVARLFERTPDARRRLLVEAEAGEPLQVRGDRGSIEQVLANLVDNALEYSAGTAPVRLAVGSVGRWGRFTVADDGPGIPAAERERIFEKFYRLDPQQSAGVTGIGLGLHIAHELVVRMDGRIGVLPQATGTTFYVDLPRAG